MLVLASLRSDGWTACPELVDEFVGIRSLVGGDGRWAAKTHTETLLDKV